MQPPSGCLGTRVGISIDEQCNVDVSVASDALIQVTKRPVRLQQLASTGVMGDGDCYLMQKMRCSSWFINRASG